MTKPTSFGKIIILIIAIGLIGYGLYSVGFTIQIFFILLGLGVITFTIGFSLYKAGVYEKVNNPKDNDTNYLEPFMEIADTVQDYNEELIKRYNEMVEYESKDVSANVKAEAWEAFMDFIGTGNPYSDLDEDFLQKAEERIRYWRDGRGGPHTPTTLHPIHPTTPPKQNPMKIVFEDHFANNSKNWSARSDQDCTLTVEKGKYVFHHKRETGSWYTYYPVDLDQSKDFEIEAVMGKVEGVDNHGYGITWGYKNPDNNFQFCVDGLGSYFYGKNVNDTWQDIIKWTPSKHIKTYNSVNKLRLTKEDEKVKFYVNDSYINDAPFEKFFAQKIGFVIYRKMKVEIFYFCVRQ